MAEEQCVCALCLLSIVYDFVLYHGTTWRAQSALCRRNIRYLIELPRMLLVLFDKTLDIVRAKNAKSEVHKLMRIQLGVDQLLFF